MGDTSPRTHILHRSLVVDALHSDKPHKDAHLVLTRVRSWTRCSKMVSNVVGNIVFSAVYSMGRQSRTISGHSTLVMAGSARRHSGRRAGNDSLAGELRFFADKRRTAKKDAYNRHYRGFTCVLHWRSHS